MPNAALAYAVLDHIKANPDEWNQEIWACGTKGCFAGWATVLGNPTAAVHFPSWLETRLHRSRRQQVYIDGFRESVRKTAIRLLGIREYEADLLFAAHNTYGDLEHYVTLLFGPRPEPVVSDVDIDDRDAVVSALFDQVADHQVAITEIQDRIMRLGYSERPHEG